MVGFDGALDLGPQRTPTVLHSRAPGRNGLLKGEPHAARACDDNATTTEHEFNDDYHSVN
jgi:hypothetical protein